MKQRYRGAGRKTWNKVLFRISIALAAVFALSGIIGSIWVYGIVQDAPPLDEEAFIYSNSSTVYDQNGEEIVALNAGEDRQSISIEEVPEHVQEAFIAIEDNRFYDHSGVDFRRIGGAVRSNISDGFGAEGGSTITQQVVKNSLLTAEKSMDRKIQEAYLALQMEREYSKGEILELYLNKIYFGNGAYGIASAASQYFDKELAELTTVEAALLAGLPQRPAGYDPYQHPDLAEDRRDTVLYVMRENDFISAEEYSEAAEIAVSDMLASRANEYEVSDAFMDQVFKELETIEEIDASSLYTAGVEIHTTYDQEAQVHVDEVLNTDEFVEYPDEDFQAGVTLIDNQTGEIKAIGGGRNQEAGEDRTNYATNISRSPGSTIKPILSYGPAIENLQWSTYQQINDEEMTYTDSEQEITNYNDEHHGEVSMREALRSSWNIPAVKTFQEVGGEQAGEFAAGLGIDIEGSIYESYALGSFSDGISPLELGGAYAAFANEGQYNEPHAVKRIVFSDGEEIVLEPESSQAMSDYTSYMVTDMLKDVVEEGTGRAAAIDGVPVAGKTGTTNFDEETMEQYNISDGVPDVWFAGYTTEYTVSVWTGYSQITEENYISSGEETEVARNIFREIMTETIDGDTADFVKPDSVEEVIIDTQAEARATESTSAEHRSRELFVIGTSIEDAFNVIDPEEEDEEDNNNNENGENNENNENNENGNNDNEENNNEEANENNQENELNDPGNNENNTSEELNENADNELNEEENNTSAEENNQENEPETPEENTGQNGNQPESNEEEPQNNNTGNNVPDNNTSNENNNAGNNEPANDGMNNSEENNTPENNTGGGTNNSGSNAENEANESGGNNGAAPDNAGNNNEPEQNADSENNSAGSGTNNSNNNTGNDSGNNNDAAPNNTGNNEPEQNEVNENNNTANGANNSPDGNGNEVNNETNNNEAAPNNSGAASNNEGNNNIPETNENNNDGGTGNSDSNPENEANNSGGDNGAGQENAENTSEAAPTDTGNNDEAGQDNTVNNLNEGNNSPNNEETQENTANSNESPDNENQEINANNENAPENASNNNNTAESENNNSSTNNTETGNNE
ncbi:transglycosylase domain-containing protein [Alkalicoccus daliensis]|uniref:Penicillin-binding protein 1A n=1 Tax=Alkalicoccus daliensis TaxID=745820 RepID=A0A1H0EPY2_9BACI|nr:PBP1A family penicillin-binding protein [Alkalicoccus daliensis]SDN84464.1 penicillin-binding protein 1A [Alkalicoccus daliensis]